jgi:hypothetical protein
MNNYTREEVRVKEKDGLEAEDGEVSWSLVVGRGMKGPKREGRSGQVLELAVRSI